jgi:hypothetical protein
MFTESTKPTQGPMPCTMRVERASLSAQATPRRGPFEVSGSKVMSVTVARWRPANLPEKKRLKTPRNLAPPQLGTLSVTVKFDPLSAPGKNVTVTIDGPTTLVGKTDANGVTLFENIPIGFYTVSAVYSQPDPLVDLAMANVGKEDWAYSKAKDTHPVNSNKCNLFVYDQGKAAGRTMPLHSYFSKRALGYKNVPLLAGQWADPKTSIASWSIVTSPEPGDIIAWSHKYLDASGHVGIVGYPEQNSSTGGNVSPASTTVVSVSMKRTVITAEDDKILHGPYKFWHFYDEGNADEIANISFRRYSTK